MIDLGPTATGITVGLSPVGDLSFSINELGQVAFLGLPDPQISTSARAMVWLPSPVYGFLSAGTHDLHADADLMCGGGFQPTSCPGVPTENFPDDAVRWSSSIPLAIELPEIDPDQSGTALARHVDADLRIVGSSVVRESGTICPELAAMWLPDGSGGHVVHEIHAVCQDAFEFGIEKSRAESSRPLGDESAWIVGTEIETLRGLVWHHEQSTECLCCDDLSARVLRPLAGSPSEGWEVRQALDVNSHGHVVAVGTRLGAAMPTRAFLLTCAADLNGDLRIDGADMGLFLGAWEEEGSAADLDGDGVVGGSDLGLLLGGCSGTELCRVSGTVCLVVEEMLVSGPASFSGPSVNAAVTAMGFVDMETFAAWSATASSEQLEGMALSLIAVLQSSVLEEES